VLGTMVTLQRGVGVIKSLQCSFMVGNLESISIDTSADGDSSGGCHCCSR
jgi:hypothetical protein